MVKGVRTPYEDEFGVGMLLALEPLWRDHDGMLEFRFSVHGSGFAAEINFYDYPEAMETFGRTLREFPRSSADEVVFENGSNAPNSYSWSVLRAFVFDGVGHSALEVECQRNGTRLASARSRFAVELEPASINRLGSELASWASSAGEQTFVFTTEHR
jgi:hypothetical protein